jgi:DNA-binding MarR family transcriptional regulator
MPDRATEPSPENSVAFLLVQLGMHLARRFGDLLKPLGLEQRQAGMLIRLAQADGRSQQAIAGLIGVNPTRMVFLTDELEQLGLVERRRNPADRRSHALYLTEAGTAMLARVREVTRAHEAATTASLSHAERDQVTALLQRLASDQGLAEHSLPGMPPRHAPVPARGSAPPSRGQAPGPRGPEPHMAGDTGPD